MNTTFSTVGFLNAHPGQGMWWPLLSRLLNTLRLLPV